MADEFEAVPRLYRETMFRSTLEADWAATLDGLEIKWEYEPKTFTLPSGVHYLPDFRLPEIGTWLEVKGAGIPREEKARELARVLACHCDGKCTCAWPGGEIVLIGRASLREEGLRFGAVRWEDALGGNALLGRCEECSSRCWIRPRHSLACRRCVTRGARGRFDHLLNSGDVEFRHADRIERFDS